MAIRITCASRLQHRRADTARQIAVVRQLTELASRGASDPTLLDRTWVILAEAIEGGWGLKGHAHTNAELVSAARAEMAKLKG
jgi:phenylpyruvate tautomerase PptA (4-oxalocrotonate tautomerase family)